MRPRLLRSIIAALSLTPFAAGNAGQPAPAAHGRAPQQAPPGAAPAAAGSVQPPAAARTPAAMPAASSPTPPAAPTVNVGRFGRFDLETPPAQLARSPDFRACTDVLSTPAGHADCAVPTGEDKVSRVQLAWDETRPGGEIIALRLLFDPAQAPPLTDLEWQLTRTFGPPALEQLRREREQKMFTLQWEDPERRTTLEAQGTLSQPSRAVAMVLERKPRMPSGELAGLRPRPFPGMRIRLLRRLDWDGQPYGVVWGTSLTALQEALGEAGPSWTQQRSYVGIFKLEPATDKRARHWRALWERISGEDEDDPQRVMRVDTRDVTADGTPDVTIELSCSTCGNTASEVLVKTVRTGKLVDLLSRRDLFRAQIEMAPGKVRIREPEGEDGATVSTYAYDRGKGAFVLAREERLGSAAPLPAER